MSDTGEEKSRRLLRRSCATRARKGQVSRSQDLVSAAGVSAAIAYVGMRAELIAHQWREILLLAADVQDHAFSEAVRELVSALFALFARTVLPLLLVVTASGVFASVATRGSSFSLDPIKPKFENVNPATGFDASWVSRAGSSSRRRSSRRSCSGVLSSSCSLARGIRDGAPSRMRRHDASGSCSAV